jgi:alkanesulfonate monooxygenase SsuD/methylene tetrahydromethanopterin reductase-like flavin-dependent oxidoreductase (luciferase family)
MGHLNKVKFGIVAPAGEDPKRLLDFIVRAEGSEFDSFWAGDHMVFMKPVAYDVLSTITAAALTTRKISMGSFTDAHKYHPAVLAQRLATIDRLTDGRFILGLGLGEAMNLDPFGIKWDKPLSRMVESIKLIRMLWEKEEPFNFEGRFFTFKKAALGAKPTNGQVPIYVAAHLPKSLRVAAEMGDGWITLPQPPELFSRRRKQVDDWRINSGRSLDHFDKCLYIFISIADNKESAAKSFENFRHTIIWSELYEEAYGTVLPKEYEGFNYMKVITTDERDRQKIVDLGNQFSQQSVFDFTLSGSAMDCIARIEKYIDAGVNHFLIHDFSADRDRSYRDLTERVIPYFR